MYRAVAERKEIERAKGMLMQQRGCGEEEAYRLLRKTAMDAPSGENEQAVRSKPNRLYGANRTSRTVA